MHMISSIHIQMISSIQLLLQMFVIHKYTDIYSIFIYIYSYIHYIYIYFIFLESCHDVLQLSNFIYVKGDLTSIYISTVKQNHTLPLPPSSSARNEVEIYKAKLRQEFGYSTLVFGGLVDTEWDCM